jgi:membrane-anchored mycosin MYCP
MVRYCLVLGPDAQGDPMVLRNREFGSAHFHDNEIVVATPDLRLVLGRLESEGVPAAEVERAEELGLALVVLAEDAVTEWGKGHPQAQELGDSQLVLDALFESLYKHFKNTYGGWTPTFGKNRDVDRAEGNHTIGGGDEGVPRPADELGARAADSGAGVTVGVADTDLYPNPWFNGAYLIPPSGLWSAAEYGQVPNYESGHAAFVVGTILQQAPGARIEVRPVLEKDGSADSWAVAKQLVRFERLGIQILNLSLGCFTVDNEAPLVLQAALERLDPDIVVIAAAGNYADEKRDQRRPLWPAAMPRVVAVGATDAGGKVAPWSPEPNNWPWVNALTRGFDLTSTYIMGPVELPAGSLEFKGFATWSGTSFAAAKVSGEVAAETRPGVPAAEALRRLLDRHRRDDGTVWIP